MCSDTTDSTSRQDNPYLPTKKAPPPPGKLAICNMPVFFYAVDLHNDHCTGHYTDKMQFAEPVYSGNQHGEHLYL